MDKGKHTTFVLQTDGKGNPLPSARKERMAQLQHRPKQFQMDSNWDRGLNEGLRNIGMLGANCNPPVYVQQDATRFLEAAVDARSPGRRRSRKSLDAGAILLAARRDDIERAPGDLAEHAKTTEERVCGHAENPAVDGH